MQLQLPPASELDEWMGRRQRPTSSCCSGRVSHLPRRQTRSCRSDALSEEGRRSQSQCPAASRILPRPARLDGAKFCHATPLCLGFGSMALLQTSNPSGAHVSGSHSPWRPSLVLPRQDYMGNQAWPHCFACELCCTGRDGAYTRLRR